MSEEVIVVIIIVGVLDIALLALALRERHGGEEVPDQPEGWAVTADGAYWNNEVDTRRRTQLDDAREAAKSWGQTITVLLGVFATVAFVKGPETFDKIPGDNAYAVVGLIAVAGAAAAAAIYLAAIAAQGAPSELKHLDGWRLYHLVRTRAASVAEQLRASRVLTLVAAVTLLGAMCAAWLASLSARGSAEKAEAFLVSAAGETICGTLSRGNDGKLVLERAEQAPVELTDVTQVTKVEACPD